MSRLNLDFSKCIHEVHNIGATTYVNVCDGTRMTVNWGIGDWLAVGGVILIVSLIGMMLMGFAWMIWRNEP